MFTGVGGDAFGEFFHVAEDGFAMFATVFGPVFGGHFHAVGVDVAEEGEGLLWHAVPQAGAPDEEGGFHEGAGGVAQQDPVDGIMDGGFEAGAVEVDVAEVDGLGEAEINGLGIFAGAGEEADEAGVDGAQAGFVNPMGEAVAGAFGKGFDAIDPADAQEPLQQGAVGKTNAEVPVVHFFEMAGDVASQGEDGALAEVIDLLGSVLDGIKAAMLHGEGDEVLLQAGTNEQFVDTDEVVALLMIIF